MNYIKILDLYSHFQNKATKSLTEKKWLMNHFKLIKTSGDNKTLGNKINLHKNMNC